MRALTHRTLQHSDITYGLHMHKVQLRALLLCLGNPHVPGDSSCPGSIVDSYQSCSEYIAWSARPGAGDGTLMCAACAAHTVPLLHCAWDISWDSEPLLFNLCVEAVQVKVYYDPALQLQGLGTCCLRSCQHAMPPASMSQHAAVLNTTRES